ncbi:MAG: secretin N-terminal domain-containing protein [Nitrosomonadales bacterium]|nr:secretin N-terminal domain-containing protein [Nitrosomonadales bacterium]
MKGNIWMVAGALTLAGCATGNGGGSTAEAIRGEVNAAVQVPAKAGNKDAVDQALLPPLAVVPPKADEQPSEARFDLAVNGTAANQVFSAIVSGTRYSMLVHPDVVGGISLNLKDVTVFEALEAIRELYGYDYKIDGTRIFIQPANLQTRIFQVNYLTGLRAGTSSLRVSSGSVSDSANTSSSATGVASNTPGGSRSQDGSKVTMTSSSDFWEELSHALTAIVGAEKGRSVVVSPISGVIVVRAMPDELKNVAAYLKASQISIERQVILEAKIVEVQLNDSFQSGVNWSAFRNKGNSAGSLGVLGQGTTLAAGTANPGGALAANPLIGGGLGTVTPGTNLIASGAATGSLIGLAFQTSNFAALLSFLESQGNVQVLSSPRIATLNNQKAVLKVGTDEFFVTNVSTTTTTGTATTTTPSVTLQPFFSGIALDVTPRIDQNNEVILHVHPSVSTVTTVNKTVNLGTGATGAANTLNLPLASSSISETDSIVRARDGQIVAIGGLMRQASNDARSGLPGLPKTLFGQTSITNEKRELVILIKPMVVDSDQDWSEDIARSRDRFNRLLPNAPK